MTKKPWTERNNIEFFAKSLDEKLQKQVGWQNVKKWEGRFVSYIINSVHLKFTSFTETKVTDPGKGQNVSIYKDWICLKIIWSLHDPWPCFCTGQPQMEQYNLPSLAGPITLFSIPKSRPICNILCALYNVIYLYMPHTEVLW